MGRMARTLVVGIALATVVALADDVAWVFEGSTNRTPVATLASSSASTLLITLDNAAVESASITMSTCPIGTILFLR